MESASGFLDPAGFAFVAALERAAPAIRAELDLLLIDDPFQPWPEKGLYDKGWDVFGLYFFGSEIAANCAKCPRTAAAVQAVPDLTTAGFSRLAPNTRIKPHVGYTDRVLRCHLGLIAPAGCAIRVGGETQIWREGRCMVFDDTVEHEAWNDSAEDRVVLLLDFEKKSPSRAGA